MGIGFWKPHPRKALTLEYKLQNKRMSPTPPKRVWLLMGVSLVKAWSSLSSSSLSPQSEVVEVIMSLGGPSMEEGTDSMKRSKRLFWVGAGAAYGLIYAAPMISWYDWRSAKGWRWFDDGREWKQVDKVGHTWTTYQLSRIGYVSAQAAGYPSRQALWIGAALAWSYQATIEIADGFFPKWGASLWDLAGNTAGSLLFLLRERVLERTNWDIELKFSFHWTSYAAQRPEVLGRGLSQILKDYNGQTYWLCVYRKRWPVGLALGYGASGLLGGYGEVPWPEIAARERRRWIVSVEPYWPFWIRRPQGGLIWLTSIKLPLPALLYEARKVTLVGVYF